MPITPLHVGAALPFEFALRARFSTTALVLANAVMDIQPVLALGFGVPIGVHGWTYPPGLAEKRRHWSGAAGGGARAGSTR